MMRYAPRVSRIVDQRLQFLSSYEKEEMSASELLKLRPIVGTMPVLRRTRDSAPQGLATSVVPFGAVDGGDTWNSLQSPGRLPNGLESS